MTALGNAKAFNDASDDPIQFDGAKAVVLTKETLDTLREFIRSVNKQGYNVSINFTKREAD